MAYTTVSTVRSLDGLFTSDVVSTAVMNEYLEEAGAYIDNKLQTTFTTTPPLVEHAANHFVLYRCYLKEYGDVYKYGIRQPNMAEIAGKQLSACDNLLNTVIEKGGVLDASGTFIEIGTVTSQDEPLTNIGDTQYFAFSKDGQDNEDAGEDSYLLDDSYI